MTGPPTSAVDFEQQVAQALEKLLAYDCDGLNNPAAYELATMLAPRVAAALRAGTTKAWNVALVTPGALLRRLKQEVGELDRALKAGADVERVMHEAADVANFAAMIADQVREGIWA